MTDYGTDLSCVSDLTPNMAETNGTHAVAEAIARRLQTPRGSLIGDANYGFALTDYVNDDVSQQDIAIISSNTQQECLKDERVSSAKAQLTFANNALVATISLVAAPGPFTLVLSISNLTTNLFVVPQ